MVNITLIILCVFYICSIFVAISLVTINLWLPIVCIIFTMLYCAVLSDLIDQLIAQNYYEEK